ncbi:hypothetical protein PFISCL1PPCAC_2415, partial [Pristionchus fissidentatus]
MIYLLLLLFLPLSEGIRCIDCTYNGTSKVCNADCVGDVCGVWKWNDKGKEFIRQGCISGLSQVKIGCRTNQIGASLCICNDFDRCNSPHRSVSTVPTLPVVRLPSVDCVSLLHLHPTIKQIDDSPLQIESSHARCHSDYCHFTRTESSVQSTMGNLSISLCSPHPQFEFDVRIHSSSFLRGLPTNFCYRLKASRHSTETDCVCSTKYCNRKLVKPIAEGPVQCYTVDGTMESDKVDSNPLCHGDICFIRQSEDGRFSKGCLSMHPMGNDRYRINPGNRSIFGEKQWYCNQQLCNLSLDRLIRSMNRKEFNRMPLVVNGEKSRTMIISLLFIGIF